MIDESVFQVGDRVKIKPWDNWVQPFRKFGEEGRMATVVHVWTGRHGDDRYRIEFDVKRRGARPHVLLGGDRDLIFVERPSTIPARKSEEA